MGYSRRDTPVEKLKSLTHAAVALAALDTAFEVLAGIIATDRPTGWCCIGGRGGHDTSLRWIGVQRGITATDWPPSRSCFGGWGGH